MKVRRLAPADIEAIEAAQYYKAIDPKLSDRLIKEFEASIQRIVRFPQGWKPIDNDLRQCVIKGFPYVVIYAVRGEEIIVVAFANTHRQPGYWRDRLTNI
ncbi:MAG: type II toxin-antitoxin system RelE/ParE family toxin [Burkholderiales bacterium]|nr:MAG: type II toxin-antitoxin system RelE/ParE family toxin [Burkholderiales bacterium]